VSANTPAVSEAGVGERCARQCRDPWGRGEGGGVAVSVVRADLGLVWARADGARRGERRAARPRAYGVAEPCFRSERRAGWFRAHASAAQRVGVSAVHASAETCGAQADGACRGERRAARSWVYAGRGGRRAAWFRGLWGR